MKCYGQITIKSIDDPITIILTNENHTFLGTVSGSAIPSSITTGIIAYKNTDRIAVTVGSISTPNGINAAVTDNNSANTAIEFTVTSALNTSGTISIPITCDNRNFTKLFTYTLSIPQEGEAAKAVTITASSQVFQSNDAGKTFTPDSIKLTPLFQGGVSFSKWQYSINGGTSWADVSSGTHGLSVASGVLTIDKASDLFTDTVTAIVFKCLSNNSSYFDTMTILKLYYDVSNIQDEIETIVKTEMSGVESRVDAVEKSITNEVWRNTMITVNDEEGNPIQKSIEDLLVSQVTDMNGISMEVQDVKTNISNLENTMEENVSQLEMTTQGIKQMVESNYITTKDAEDMVAKSEASIINQTSDMIDQSVTDNITGANSYVNQKVNQITQQIEDANGSISNVQQTVSGISQKVETVEGNVSSLQQTVGGFNQTVENIEGDISQIQQTAQGLQTQITDNKNNLSELKLDVEGFQTNVESQFSSLSGEIETNKTNIAQNAQQIELAVEKTQEVSDDLHNNYYNKTETEAKIKVASESITSTVKTTVTEEVGKIKIGGRNLLKNSSLRTDTNEWTTDPTSSSNVTISQEEKDTHTCTLIDSAVFSISDYHFWQKLEVGKLELNATYTASLWILAENISKSNAGATPACQFEITNAQATGVDLHYHQKALDNGYADWTKLSWSFTVTNDTLTTASTIYFGLYLKNTTGDFYIRDLQLEKGSVATDWTPAPEDMATSEEVENAQSSANQAQATADTTESRVSVAESTIQQLSNAISSLIVDENGESMMTQTSDGWRFEMGSINSQLSDTANQLNDLAGSVEAADQTIENLNGLANDLAAKTAYIVMTTDDSGSPCIELGKSDNQFKLRITNTSIDFMEGSVRVAYIDNQTLYIEKAVIKNELQIGDGSGYIWQKRTNNHLGLRWFGGGMKYGILYNSAMVRIRLSTDTVDR